MELKQAVSAAISAFPRFSFTDFPTMSIYSFLYIRCLAHDLTFWLPRNFLCGVQFDMSAHTADRLANDYYFMLFLIYQY